jgi:hypothetical protein
MIFYVKVNPLNPTYLDNLFSHVPLLWLGQVQAEMESLRAREGSPHMVEPKTMHEAQLLLTAQEREQLQHKKHILPLAALAARILKC